MSEPFPRLAVADWQATRDTLHMWLQIVGKIRMVSSPAVNHYWHATLRVSARGLSTGAFDARGGLLDIEFDLIAHRLGIRCSDGREIALPLAGLSVADFYAAVFGALHELGVRPEIHASPNEVEVALPFATDTVHATYVPEHAHAFWQQLIYAQRQLEAFRAEFRGKSSPVHFFWGALDLAVTRFSGRPAPAHPGGAPHCPDEVMRESYSDELSSAGFWPGGGEEGAFYSYGYPVPAEFASAVVPSEAFYRAELGEFLLPAERVRTAADPDELVREFLRATARASAELGGWPDRVSPSAPRS